MQTIRNMFFVLAGMLASFGPVSGQTPNAASDVTAIDILFAPDDVMIGRAKAANARLRDDYPNGFELDATHNPHVTIIQRFVRTADLAKVNAAIAKVMKQENPTSWSMKATGYYDIPIEKMGVAGIVIEPTSDLIRFQQRVIDAVAPFTVETGTADAFAPRPDGKPIEQLQPMIDYVAAFVPKSSGKNFNPHVSTGVGNRALLDKMKAEPFASFTFKARSVDIYQLGEFGTAQKLLWTSADPLPSWNDGPHKKAILDFVAKVTKEGGPDFVPVAERIATFDNDGTLWCESPVPVQLFFAIDRVKALAPKHPEWKQKQPFKAVLEEDMKSLMAAGEHGLLELVMSTHAGMTTEEFEVIVKDWFATAKHPKFKRPFTDLVYQPMLEVLAHLRANGFKTYVVSGGGIEFMRPWMEKVYGIPPEQVIGSSIKTKFEIRDGKPVIVRQPTIDFIDDKVGKPIAINRFIGRRPIMAFGNSDGDFEMIEWTTAGKGPRFGLIVHHTDADREYAYDRKSSLARLDRGLNESQKRGWVVVSMKDDWNQVFPVTSK